MEAQLIRVYLPDGNYLEAQGVSIECLGEPVRIDFGKTVDGFPFPGGILAPQSWTEIQTERELIRLKGKGKCSWVFIFQQDMATLFRDVDSFTLGLSSVVCTPAGWKSVPIKGTPFVFLTKGVSNVFKCPTKDNRRRRSRSKDS